VIRTRHFELQFFRAIHYASQMLRWRDVARLLVKFCGLLILLEALIRLPAAG
jgi:hypothetical protein